MKIGAIGKKIGMTHIFIKEGNNVKQVPVTVIKIEPNYILQVKNKEKDGYNAIQVGSLKNKWYRGNKPILFHVMKAFGMSKEEIEKEIQKRKSDKIFTFQVLKEFRVDDTKDFKLGDSIDVSKFEKDSLVNITGRTKGRGFQGVMKRHGFAGGPKSHGSHFHRAPGSIGMCASPSRVLKGTKLPGHMGTNRVTLRKVKIMDVIPEKNVILVKGGVPGPTNGIVYIEQ